MSEKYLNIDLNDPRASAIADVMGNKTAKKMLDLISEKEVSESDIASELKIPLNTVGYNIEKLLKAGLIEKSSNFFWSVKGKKIPTYKLSNKKILISPKRLTMSPIAMIASVIGVIALIVLIMGMNGSLPLVSQNSSIERVEGLKQFSSYSELDEFLKENINESDRYNNYYGRGEILSIGGDVAENSVSDASGAPSVSKSGANTYSQTNIQVEGVDEPDFVKNDGKYIYLISGMNLYIVEAYPANEMKIIANISLDNYATNMFVNQDKIVVFSNYYESYSGYDIDAKLGEPEAISSKMIASDSIMPCLGYGCRGYSKTLTNVLVYDISDRQNPLISNNYSFDGSYMDARMINDYVYLVSQNNIYSGNWPRPLYSVDGVEREVEISDVYYSEEFNNNLAFTSVSAINLNDNGVETKVYLLSADGTIYVSEKNIYLTNQKWMDYDKQTQLLMKEGVRPVMPSEYQDDIDEILMDDSLYGYQKEQKIMEMVESYSKTLGKTDEGSDFNKRLAESIENARAIISKEYQKTIIHKISIDEMNIEYVAEGEVYGYLLNQFSLDEYEGNLRLAVTSGNMWGSENSLNHMYVLNDKLEIIGSVEDLAKGERIYSARFMGERAYMVTFRQVDPLYVIDLSEAENPEVLGYLKVTGYSGYLHPYDENHIIGVGMEGDENGRVNGVKIALFDVGDVANPIEQAKYVIKSEEKWSFSSSNAIYDHKAFLFDKEKNLLVLPIQYSYYVNERYQNWVGVYVFYIDSETIELDAKISHIDPYVPKYDYAREAEIGEERKDYDGNIWTKINEDQWRAKELYKNYTEEYSNYDYGYYYNPYEQGNEYIDYFPGGVNYNPNDWDKQIQRSLYMDDALYTVSLGMIKANSLNTFDEISKVEINSSYKIYDYVAY